MRRSKIMTYQTEALIKALCKTRLVVSVSHGALRKPKLPLLQIHGAKGTTVAEPLHEKQKTTSLGIRMTFLSHLYPCSNVKSRSEDILLSRAETFAFFVFLALFRESLCLWKFQNSKTRKFFHAKS